MVHGNAVAASQRELEPTAQADTPYEGKGGIGHFGETVKQMPASGNKALNLLCTVKAFELFNVGTRNKATCFSRLDNKRLGWCGVEGIKHLPKLV